jgi:hypothetical protein
MIYVWLLFVNGEVYGIDIPARFSNSTQYFFFKRRCTEIFIHNYDLFYKYNSRAEAEKERSSTSTPVYDFMACRNKFTFSGLYLR